MLSGQDRGRVRPELGVACLAHRAVYRLAGCVALCRLLFRALHLRPTLAKELIVPTRLDRSERRYDRRPAPTLDTEVMG